MDRIKIFIDTDMGLDVDDAVALTLAAYSPEVHLHGVSTIFGDTVTRARCVMELLEMVMGVPLGFPVAPGSPEPLCRARDTFWDGYDHKQILRGLSGGEPCPLSGDDLLIETVNSHPGEVVVLGIGPLTNIAKAFVKDPSVVTRIKRLVIMGGVFPGEDPGLPEVEYNIGSDPEAAKTVLSADCDILLIPLNVTTKVELTPVHLQQLRSSRNPAGDILASMAEYWWELKKTSSSPMHDPLAVAAVFQPELLQVAPGKVAVTCEAGSDGQTRFFPDNDARTQIAVGVDAEAFLKLLLERICP